MKNLSQILRALMDEMHLSESELARRTEVGQPVIHRILSGETDNPRVATLSQIANYFSISISQLIGDAPLPENRIPGTHNHYTHSWSQVPLLDWEQAIHWPEHQIQHPFMVATDVPIGKQAFALKVKDVTMAPRFVEGTLLIVDPARTPADRDFAILYVEGQKNAIFKQILKDGNDTYLKPLNPDFQTTLLDPSQHRIIGTVVQARDDFLQIKI